MIPSIVPLTMLLISLYFLLIKYSYMRLSSSPFLAYIVAYLAVYQPITCLRICSKLNLVKLLVKISGRCFLVSLRRILISCGLIIDRKRWYLIPMWLVLEVMIGHLLWLNSAFMYYPPILLTRAVYFSIHISCISQVRTVIFVWILAPSYLGIEQCIQLLRLIVSLPFEASNSRLWVHLRNLKVFLYKCLHL